MEKKRIVSLETRKRMSESNGRWNAGRLIPAETKKLMSESHKINAKNNPNYGMNGKHHSDETKKKMRDSHLGPKCNLWKGGITKLKRHILNLDYYKQWRSNIFQRDNWTCQTCGKRGIALEAHHIIRLADILIEYNIKTIEEAISCKELWDINNGVTLCKDCHKLTPGYMKHKT